MGFVQHFLFFNQKLLSSVLWPVFPSDKARLVTNAETDKVVSVELNTCKLTSHTLKPKLTLAIGLNS